MFGAVDLGREFQNSEAPEAESYHIQSFPDPFQFTSKTNSFQDSLILRYVLCLVL